MLADPGLVEAQRVEVFDEREVAVEGRGRVLTNRVKRRQEYAEAKLTCVHVQCLGTRWADTIAELGGGEPGKACCLPGGQRELRSRTGRAADRPGSRDHGAAHDASDSAFGPRRVREARLPDLRVGRPAARRARQVRAADRLQPGRSAISERRGSRRRHRTRGFLAPRHRGRPYTAARRGRS